MKRPPSPKVFEWINTIPNEGLIRYAGVLGRHHLMPTTPRALSELFVTKAYDFQKVPTISSTLRLVIGDGLVVAEGDVHRFQRKNLSPMFSYRHIKDLYPLMWSKSVELINAVNTEISTSSSPETGCVIEVLEWASRAALDMIGIATLGRDFHSLHNNDDELASLYEWLFHINFSKKLWFAINIFLPKKIIDLLPWKAHHDM